jgi:hypothetical protein
MLTTSDQPPPRSRYSRLEKLERLAVATSGATPAEREAARQMAIKLRADLHEKVT